MVQKIDEWEAGDSFDSLKIKGRGGTRIRPVFEHVAREIDEQIDWMVCFTDMGIEDYPSIKEAPDFPVSVGGDRSRQRAIRHLSAAA